MKKYLLPAALILSLSVSSAFKPGQVHLKGYIDDSSCASSKTSMSPGESRITCVKKCLKLGAKAVLVVGDKIYEITNQSAVTKFAGENVTVDGDLSGNAIQVTKITEDK